MTISIQYGNKPRLKGAQRKLTDAAEKTIFREYINTVKTKRTLCKEHNISPQTFDAIITRQVFTPTPAAAATQGSAAA